MMSHCEGRWEGARAHRPWSATRSQSGHRPPVVHRSDRPGPRYIDLAGNAAPPSVAGLLHMRPPRRDRQSIDLQPLAFLIGSERRAGQHAGLAVDLVVIKAAVGKNVLHAVE